MLWTNAITTFLAYRRYGFHFIAKCYRFGIPINHKLNYRYFQPLHAVQLAILRQCTGFRRNTITKKSLHRCYECNKMYMRLASNYAICLFVKLKFICTFANIDDRFVVEWSAVFPLRRQKERKKERMWERAREEKSMKLKAKRTKRQNMVTT